jgi:hypothetical protein
MAEAKEGTRKKLSLAEQKAKLEKDKLKIAALEAKVNIADLKDHILSLKVTNVGSLFKLIKDTRAGVTDIAILQTLADIGGAKVIITPKPVIPRKKTEK